MEPKVEFDRYARDYDTLLRDPVRDGFAQNSDFFNRRKWILIADFLDRHALAPAKLEWLDAGCGKGELLALGRPHFNRVAGCDPSREMVRGAADMEMRLQDAPDALPFPDASFDFVTAVCVFHHVEERHRLSLTREIHRVLRPGGTFCMIEHNPFNPATRLIVSRSPLDVDAHLLSAGQARHYADLGGLRHIESQFFLYLPEKLYTRMGRWEGLLKKVPLGGQYAMFARK
jgi:SAM-dependent methyltransferase